MIYVTIVVIKADEKYNDECKDNDDVSISMMKIIMMIMMMYHPHDDDVDDYGSGTCNNCMTSSIRYHCSTKHL
jgi:hypothetical protein